MNEHPILFSGPMVRAIREGRKTQTRRVIKLAPEDATKLRHVNGYIESFIGDICGLPESDDEAWQPICGLDGCKSLVKFPYGVAGDHLWVRESIIYSVEHDNFYYAADRQGLGSEAYSRLKRKSVPSIHMPRWASREELEVASIRIERVQDISEEDAKAEGTRDYPTEEESERYSEHPDYTLCNRCGGSTLYMSIGANGGAHFDTDCYECDTYKKRFGHLWDSINAARGYGWDVNPWVWVVEFRRLL